MKKRVLAGMMLGILAVTSLTGCSTDADVASENLSQAADNFQIERKISFINTWTGDYLLSITGLCSVKSASGTTGMPGVAVTCKVGPNEYKKHYLGLSGNVTYFSEQLGPAQVGVYHYKVTFKPSTIVPKIDMR